MTLYLFIFVAGMAGSFHCLGMCGGFACVLGRDPRGGRIATLCRHLLYNTGRVTTYAFLGGVAGVLSGALTGSATPEGVELAQRGLALAAGALMVVMALQLLGVFRKRHRRISGGRTPFAADAFVESLGGLLKARNRLAPLSFGVLNGFLPCPLVYGVLAYAAGLCLSDPSRGAVTAILLMAAFGAGTFPAMLLMGALGNWLRPFIRQWGVRAAGCFILVFGVVTITRGLLPLAGQAHMGHLL